MQGVDGGMAFTCADCGRTIFNTATIKGKQDGKIYIVGLTCVKKLLNKTVYFNAETLETYESELAKWSEAVSIRKWIETHQKKRASAGREPYELVLKEYQSRDNETLVYVELRENGKYAGSTKSINPKYKSVFNSLRIA